MLGDASEARGIGNDCVHHAHLRSLLPLASRLKRGREEKSANREGCIYTKDVFVQTPKRASPSFLRRPERIDRVATRIRVLAISTDKGNYNPISYNRLDETL